MATPIVHEQPLTMRNGDGRGYTILAGMPAASMKRPAEHNPLEGAEVTWRRQPSVTAENTQWIPNQATPLGSGAWRLRDVENAGIDTGVSFTSTTPIHGVQLNVSGQVGFIGTGSAGATNAYLQLTVEEYDAADTLISSNDHKVTEFRQDQKNWVPYSYTVEVLSPETRSVVLKMRTRSVSSTVSTNMYAHVTAPQVMVVPNRERVWSGAGSLADGHMAGFFTTPNLVGEIADNPVQGGGVRPGHLTYGVRPVTYVLYLSGYQRSKVAEELRRLNGFLAAGDITVEHHGEGYCYGGYLAAPPEVEWIGDHVTQCKVTFTLSFIDPYIYGIDWKDKTNLEALITGAISEEDTDAYFVAPLQLVDDDTRVIDVFNNTDQPMYPIIRFDAAGAADSRVFLAMVYLPSPEGTMMHTAGDFVGVEIKDRRDGMITFLTDTKSLTTYSGVTASERYVYNRKQVTRYAAMGGSLQHNPSIYPGETVRLSIIQPVNVGMFGLFIPKGRL